MSVAVVVDGHNAMHRLRLLRAKPASGGRGPDGHGGRRHAARSHRAEAPTGGSHERARTRLLARVRAAAPRGATVFFDGHPGTGAFGGTVIGGVTVRFSGDAEADQAIVDFVREERRPRRLVVVTDDLELARRVEQLGASSLRIAQFLAEVEDEPERRPHAGELDARGFTPSDFGLPDVIDLEDPPEDL